MRNRLNVTAFFSSAVAKRENRKRTKRTRNQAEQSSFIVQPSSFFFFPPLVRRRKMDSFVAREAVCFSTNSRDQASIVFRPSYESNRKQRNRNDPPPLLRSVCVCVCVRATDNTGWTRSVHRAVVARPPLSPVSRFGAVSITRATSSPRASNGSRFEAIFY